MGHRLIINPAARIRNIQAGAIVADILGAVPVPGGRPGRRGEREVASIR
jgi:MoxR-like ATPase